MKLLNAEHELLLSYLTLLTTMLFTLSYVIQSNTLRYLVNWVHMP